MHRFRVALFILTVLSNKLCMMHQPKEVADMAIHIDGWRFLDSSDYIGLQTICGWFSKTKYSMYYFYGKCGTSSFNYVLIWSLDFSKIRILGAALGTVLSRIMMVVFMHY
jgi:MATE family multidrug resistance protein